jgi:hypothetical protein
MSKLFAPLILVAISLSACNQGDDSSPAGGGNQQEPIACGSAELHESTHSLCDAMDATGVPGENGVNCRCVVGFKWDGTSCIALGGCACSGSDCNKLAETEDECQALHSACSAAKSEPIACGSSALTANTYSRCEAMDVQAAPDANGNSCFCALGFAWNGKFCQSLDNCNCVGSDCDKLSKTLDECQALHTDCGVR